MFKHLPNKEKRVQKIFIPEITSYRKIHLMVTLVYSQRSIASRVG